MKEKPIHVTQAGGGKTQRVSNALADFLAVLPTPMVRDGQSSKPKSSRSDASGCAGIRAACLAAVFYEAGIWIRFFPKIPEAGSLHFFQECVLLRSELVFRHLAREHSRWRRRRGRGYFLLMVQGGLTNRCGTPVGKDEEAWWESRNETRGVLEPLPSCHFSTHCQQFLPEARLRFP